MKSKRIMAGILGFSLVLAGCGINSAQTDVTPKDTTEQLAKAETSEETENFTTQTTEIQTEPETETQVEPVVQKVTITAVGDCTLGVTQTHGYAGSFHEYYDKYDILLEGRDPEEFKKHVAVQAQIEIGFERFLKEKNYQAIVTHFGDLGALKQLPGLAIQRLMEKGYGFGAEGDWKVAAMVRLMKIMTAGMKDAKELPC